MAEELAWLGPAFGRCGEREIGATVEAVGGWLGETLERVDERVATNAQVERLRVEQMRLAQEGW